MELLSLPVITESERERALIAVTSASMSATNWTHLGNDVAPSGWRNISAVPQRMDWAFNRSGESVEAAVVSWPSPDHSGRVTLRASDAAAGWSGEDGVSYRIDVLESVGTTDGAQRHVALRVSLTGLPAEYWVSTRGDPWVNDGTNSQTFCLLPRFADLDLAAAGGGPSAPVPGTVVSVEVAAGDEVSEGQTWLSLRR